jgi:putative ABC transport system permease protein
VSIQLTLAWRYLWGHKLRTFLTMISITLGVMLIFGLNGIMPTIINAFEASTLAAVGQVDITATSVSADSFDPAAVQKVARVNGVDAAAGSLVKQATIPALQGNPAVAVTVTGVDPFPEQRVMPIDVTSGRFLYPTDTKAVVIGQNLADTLGLKLGKTVRLPSAVGTTEFTVVGIIGGTAAPGADVVYITLPAAQQLFGQPGKINTVEAKTVSGADKKAVEDAVRRALGSEFQIGGVSSILQLAAGLQTSRTIFGLFGVLALIMGGFIILNTFRMSVSERRRDVGMLRAIGATRGTVRWSFLLEASIQGVIGTAIGIVLGWGMANLLLSAMSSVYSKYFAAFAGGFGPALIDAGTWVLAITLGVGVSLLGALIPAVSAGNLTPLEAMRPSLGEVYERAAGRRAWIGLALVLLSGLTIFSSSPGTLFLGVFTFIVGAILVAPAAVKPVTDVFGELIDLAFAREGDIARSNLQRNPNRAGITASAVMLSIAVIVAIAGVWTSIAAGFFSYIDKSMGADFLVLPQSLILSTGNVGAGPRLSEQLSHVPGIRAVSSLRVAGTKVGPQAVQVVGIDPKTYPQVASFEWTNGGDNSAIAKLAEGRTAIANGLFAGTSNLSPGSRISLTTPNGDKTYQIVGTGSDYLNAKLATIYVSQSQLQKDFGVTTDVMLLADALPGADMASVRRRIDTIMKDYPAFQVYEAAQFRQVQADTFNQILAIFYPLMFALAAPALLALVNTLAMSVLARTREIGMLRAVGSTRRQVRRMIMAESLLLTAMGVSFGLLGGVWLGYVSVSALNSLAFPMPYYFPLTPMIVAVGIGLLFGVLAALWPARRAARLNVVEALHYE